MRPNAPRRPVPCLKTTLFPCLVALPRNGFVVYTDSMKKSQPAEAPPIERSATIKAKDLPPAERQWIAAVLHVDLTDDDEFTVTLHRPLVRIPNPKDREAAREGLLTVLGQFHERMKDAPAEEVDAAIDDAFRDTRSHKQ